MTGWLMLPIIGGVVYLRYMRRRHGVWPLLWRWFSGHPLDGQLRTNASWLHPATEVFHPTGHAVRWHHLPRLYRAGIRTGLTLGTVAAAELAAVQPVAALGALTALAAFAALFGGWRGYQAARFWKHNRLYVAPLRFALTVAMDVPPPSLHVALDRAEVTVGLPREFTGGDRGKEAVTRAVTSKLGIEAPDPDWHLHGRKPQVTFTKPQPPPARVTFADILPAIEAAEPHELVMGLGKRSRPVSVSVDGDSPHLGLSMGSGDGKSVTARLIATQLLHRGALAMFLDYKLISHMWARGLPNVSYAGTPDEIHDALLWLLDEIGRRNKVALASANIRGEVTADVGPRILVVGEELNATQNRLGALWRQIKEKGDPGRSPASEALDEAMFIGRQVRVNVLQIGQRLSAKASGSGDARENLGIKMFSNPSASAWKMLVGERHALPPATDHKGRLQIVTPKTVQETQCAFVGEEDCRAYAVSGQVAVPRSDMPFVSGIAPVPDRGELESPGPDQGFVLGHPPIVPSGPPGAVTLAEAVAAGVLQKSLPAARKASQRAGFPAAVGVRGNAHLYDVGDLYAYQAKGKAA